jgi:hypothetical protein
VGTTQALIEQGAAVFSAIHARLHESQRRVLGVLGRINRWYLDDMRRGDEVAELPISREDFAKNSDIVPVSDPHIFSETQRMAQMQAVLQMSAANPGMFDQKAVLSRMLKQLKVPDIQELLPNATKPMEHNAADENAAIGVEQAEVIFGMPRCMNRKPFAFRQRNAVAFVNTTVGVRHTKDFGKFCVHTQLSVTTPRDVVSLAAPWSFSIRLHSANVGNIFHVNIGWFFGIPPQPETTVRNNFCTKIFS